MRLKLSLLILFTNLYSFPVLASDFQLNISTAFLDEGGSGADSLSRCNLTVSGNSNGNKVTYTLNQMGFDDMPLYEEYITTDTVTSSNISSSHQLKGYRSYQTPRCFLTDAYVEGIGRGQINYKYFLGEHSVGGSIYFKTLEGMTGPLNDISIAAQLLALPIADKIKGGEDFKNRLNVITKNLSLESNYNNYYDLITSGDNGFNGNVFGFSIDFLELKTNDLIDEFLAKRSVQVAKEMNLISNDLNTEELSAEIRKEILYLIRQDGSLEYGTPMHIKSSLAMSYSGKIGSGWQLNKRSNKILNSQKLIDLNSEFYFSEENKDVFNGLNVSNGQQILDYFILRDFNPSGKYDKEFAKSVLLNINGISVDFDKGLITNTNKEDGYLGRTYLSIAEDLYGKKLASLTYEELVIVKSALNSIGIDTNFAYGSLKNIEASILMRVNALLSEPVFDDEIRIGASSEILSHLNLSKGIDFDNRVKDLLFETYLYSGIDSLSQIQKVNSITVYEHFGQSGEYKFINSDTPYFNDAFNDTLSSWDIPQGWTVRFYEDTFYKGGYYTRGPGKGDARDFDNKISSIKIIQKPAFIDIKSKDVLYDTIKSLNNSTKVISSYEKIIDYNDEGVEIYSIPLTDVSFTKAMLYEIGMDKEWIERNWEIFYNQEHSRRPSLLYWYPGGEPLEQGTKLQQLKQQFEAETGRTTYKPSDMWSHYFNKMIEDISEYISLNIAFQAQMKEKAPWVLNYNQQFNLELHTSFDIIKKRYNSVFWNEIERVEAKQWVLNGDKLNYSALLGGSLLDLFYISKIHLGEPIPLNSTKNSILFPYLNNERAHDCLKFTLPPNDLYYDCKSQKVSVSSNVISEKEAIKNLVRKLLLEKKSEFKLIKTNEILLEVIKGFLPLWGTIEDIKSGNAGMAALGIIGDVFFFVPIAGDISDIATLTIKAVKNSKLASSAKFIKSSVSLNNKSRSLVVSGNVDSVYYSKKALESVVKIPLRIIDEMNPLSFGIDDLFSVGRVDIPHGINIERYIPSDGADVQAIWKYKYRDEITGITSDNYGMFFINGEHHAIKINNSYFLVKQNDAGKFFIIDEAGRNKFPLVYIDGEWQIDLSASITLSDVNDYVKITENLDEFKLIGDGIYQYGDTFSIKIDGVFFQVHYDPVYQSWYLFDEQWNRLFISGEYNGRYFIRNEIDIGICH